MGDEECGMGDGGWVGERGGYRYPRTGRERSDPVQSKKKSTPPGRCPAPRPPHRYPPQKNTRRDQYPPEVVGSHAVHLVDKADTRDAVLVSLAPHSLGLRLDTGNRVKHGDGTWRTSERAKRISLRVRGELERSDPFIPRRISLAVQIINTHRPAHAGHARPRA